MESPVDLIIVGAQRCGTTSLFGLLRTSTNVWGPKAKELHFFDGHISALEKGDLSWYRKAMHVPRAPQLGQTYLPGVSSVQIKRVEATPMYLFYPPALEYMAKLIPGVKIVVMLRDPVLRAYSHYWHVRNGAGFLDDRGFRLSDFTQAMEDSIPFARGREKMLRSGSMVPAHQWETYSYFDRGFYGAQLKRLYNLFPDEQIKIIVFEEFVQDPIKHARDVLIWLWGDEDQFPEYDKAVQVTPWRNNQCYPSMPLRWYRDVQTAYHAWWDQTYLDPTIIPYHVFDGVRAYWNLEHAQAIGAVD